MAESRTSGHTVVAEPRHSRPMETTEGTPEGLTLRAFAIGVVLCTLLGVALPYNRMVIQGCFMNLHFLDRGAIFLFFLLVLLVNPLLGLLRRRYALARGELLSIYIMLMLLLSVTTMAKLLTNFLTGVAYYATPERRDLEAVLPHVLPWLAPQDTGVIRGYYEGLAEGVSIPWGAWVAPLLSWSGLFLVMGGVFICLAVLMRRQWEEHERFVFPIMQVPLDMSDTGHGLFGPLFRSRMLWAGFAIPCFVLSLKALHNYYYFLPAMSLSTTLWIFRRTTPLPFRISFALLGYSYLMNLDVSLSIWFFNLASRILRGVFAVLGMELTSYNVSGDVGRFSSQGSTFMAFIGMGYMLALAAYSLYVARGHLRGVWSRVVGRTSRLDDSTEVLSYRQALIGIAGGCLYLGAWLYQTGISPSLILFLGVACFVVFLVMTRIVSETGYPVAYSPIIPTEFVVGTLGSSVVSSTGLVTLGFGYTWTMTRFNTVWPHAQGALRLAREIGRKRGLVLAMLAALAVGLVAASATPLKLGYTYGGLNLGRDFLDTSRLPFEEYVGRRLLEPSPVLLNGILYTGVGVSTVVLLTVLRSRFTWWPLHPIALPLTTLWWTDMYFFSVFLAWAIKLAVLKFGGANLYRMTRPLFLGVVIGEAVCMGAWMGVDYLTGMIGNDFGW